MRAKSTIFLALLPFARPALAGEPVEISSKLSATCQDAALITFWESASHLSDKDKKRALEATRDARLASRVRPAVSVQIIEAAQAAGASAHGNAGSGLTELESAREDAIAAALQTYELCVQGKFKCEHCGKSEEWWKQ